MLCLRALVLAVFLSSFTIPSKKKLPFLFPQKTTARIILEYSNALKCKM